VEIFLLLGLVAFGGVLITFSDDNELEDIDSEPENTTSEDEANNDYLDKIEVISLDELTWSDGDEDGSLPQTVHLESNSDADNLDASDMKQGLIYAGENDTVVGSDIAQEIGDFGVVITGNGKLDGGEGGNITILRGDGGLANGNGGDDTILSGAGGSTINGGNGHDLLVSNATSLYQPTATSSAIQMSDLSHDIIDGGLGNDTLHLGKDDIGTGGQGEDHFYLYDFGQTISDFDPADDKIAIQIDRTTYPIGLLDVSTIASELEFLNDEGKTKFMLGDMILFEIPIYEDLSVKILNENDLEDYTVVLFGQSNASPISITILLNNS
jgi:Ca2+-binding RTX toxin-like protein